MLPYLLHCFVCHIRYLLFSVFLGSSLLNSTLVISQPPSNSKKATKQVTIQPHFVSTFLLVCPLAVAHIFRGRFFYMTIFSTCTKLTSVFCTAFLFSFAMPLALFYFSCNLWITLRYIFGNFSFFFHLFSSTYIYSKEQMILWGSKNFFYTIVIFSKIKTINWKKLVITPPYGNSFVNLFI